MTLDAILWGLAGWVAFFIFQLVRPVRNRSGWDFVAQTAFFAAATFLLATLIKAAILINVPPVYLDTLSELWRANLAPVRPLLAVGVVIAAPIIGILTAFLWTQCHPLISGFAQILGGRTRNLEYPDTFFKMTHELLGNLTLISTKTGKVYVGILNEATSDPNEPNRFLRFSPVMSGYRRKGDLRVVFNTTYVQEIKQSASDEQAVQQSKAMPDRDVLIPLAEITSLAHFDETLHEKFVSTNVTLIEGLNYSSTIDPDENSSE